jgi:hypothetical protein
VPHGENSPLSTCCCCCFLQITNSKLVKLTKNAQRKKLTKSELSERVPVLVWDFSLLLVRLNKHTSIANKMRVPFGKNELHSLRINKSNKTKHPLLLVRNPHILNRPINASNPKKKINQFSNTTTQALNVVK